MSLFSESARVEFPSFLREFGETFLHRPNAGSQVERSGVPDFGSNSESSLNGIIVRFWVDLSDFLDLPVPGESVEYLGVIYLIVSVDVSTDGSAWLVTEKQR